MNASKLTAWKDFKAEVNTIKRTQANIGPLPMDLDAYQGQGDRSKERLEQGERKRRQGHKRK
eukprot:5906061-Amphidinium_carterae.1